MQASEKKQPENQSPRKVIGRLEIQVGPYAAIISFEPRLLTPGVGVEKLGTNQLNFMGSVGHYEAFSGIV